MNKIIEIIKEEFENLSSDDQLKKSLLNRAKQYSKYYNRDLIGLNTGLCEEIANDVIRDMGGETVNTYYIDDGFFWDSNKISNIKTKGGDYWNINNFKKYGVPPFDYNYLTTFDLLGHSWIYHNGKHYDIETIEGVNNFWNLPIYQRQLKKLGIIEK
jgi:hypothetical protein